ncbi:Uncharacterised protein [Parabacteroides distasonis]|uniref:Uncharacterized protein n=1 Tax=Parabacteroides distasonis TaxID=823 RepID=A0A173VHV6_PARDI|nr:Uncharacterised protein [Parabacteroides distasonis]
MSEETYRIFKVILMFIFAFIAWNYVQTQRYSSVKEYILVDKISKKALILDQSTHKFE